MEQPQNEEKLNNSLRGPSNRTALGIMPWGTLSVGRCSSDSLVNFRKSWVSPRVPVPKRKNRLSQVLCPSGHMTCPTKALWSQEDRGRDCADENQLCSQSGHCKQISRKQQGPRRCADKNHKQRQLVDPFLWWWSACSADFIPHKEGS